MKRKILLIEPPFYRLFKETFSLDRFPLSLAYLAGAIVKDRADAWDVLTYNADFRPDSEPLSMKNIDEAFERYLAALKNPVGDVWDQVKETVAREKPDVVGITAKSQNFGAAAIVARLVKEVDPGITVIAGGPHPTMAGHDVFKHPGIDIVAKGEGEVTIVQLLDAIAAGESLAGVDGILYLEDGQVRETPGRPFIGDLDVLPFPHQVAPDVLMDHDQYTAEAFSFVFATRGCPNACFYCGSRCIWSRKVRFRGARNVTQEVASLQKLGLGHVHFDDDLFGVNRKYLREICEALVEDCPGIRWSCEIHPKLVSDETIGWMKRAGCDSIAVGIESGNDEMLKKIRKNITIDEAVAACETIKRHGIVLQAFFMVGFPEETEQTMLDTYAAMKRISPAILSYSIFTPYPGTEAFDRCKELGLIADDYDCSLFNHQSPANFFCVNMERERFRELATEMEQYVVRITSLPDAGGYLPDDSMPVYDAYIQADDDDGNLANGTPNALEIFNAFDAHGMANEQVPTSPACSRPSQPDLSVTPHCDRVDLSWPAVGGVDHYVVLRSEWFEDTTYFVLAELAPSVTSFSDTEVAPEFDYYYTVLAVDSAGCESTVENPLVARLPDQPVLSITAIAADDVPMGNRSGFADPGEQVDLVLSLGNVGRIDATSVTGQVTATTPGVTMLLDSASWPDLVAGDSQANSTGLRFETDADVVSCGDLLEFQLVPSDAAGCAGQPSFFSVRLGEFVDGEHVCDDTPACYVEPTFSGLQSASSGVSCGEIDLAWSAAESNCVNAVISYRIYRSGVSGFTPGPQTLVAEGVGATSLTDFALEPGQTYYYVVRAFDSRSGEEGNSFERSAVPPLTPDISAPAFAGLASAGSGVRCGEAVLGWQPAIESCNAPVTYEIHRSTESGFVPGPDTLVATTLSTAFVDTSADPASEFTYLVRARDAVGNVDANGVKRTLLPGAEPLEVFRTGFESTDSLPNEGGWAAIDPNDASPEGLWAWGDPMGTSYQPENDATPSPGSNCWITGLGTQSNGDVDDGTTTLLSRRYDMSGNADPVVAYRRWFTNDRGASPGDATDTFKVDVSNDDGQSWTPLEEVGAGTPLSWVLVQFELALPVTDQMRFRFSASDLGSGSLVEAGIDEFALIDNRAGCDDCFFPPAQTLCEIGVSKSGDDIILDWSAAPIPSGRVVIYDVKSCSDQVKIGTVDGATSFVHQSAALSPDAFNYRATFVDDCGEEIAFCGRTDCP